jgi:hypothetical protein
MSSTSQVGTRTSVKVKNTRLMTSDNKIKKHTKMGEYMRRNGSRTIKVKKADLIARIEENKATHIEAYAKAVVAYKKEALKQLSDLTQKVENGDLNVRLNLTTPVDNRKNYDKIIDMFNWEVEDIVELEQSEFNEYVLDETEFARHAMASNSMYLG